MEKGISKHWSPTQERTAQSMIDECPSFATRHLMITLRDLLKYDQRTRAGKKTVAQAKLRLATCSDKDLEELAKIEEIICEKGGVYITRGRTVEESLEILKEKRAKIREQGIKRGELECP